MSDTTSVQDASLHQFAPLIRRLSWLGFSCQLALGLLPVILLVILLITRTIIGVHWIETTLMFSCLLFLIISIYWSFKYAKLASRFQDRETLPIDTSVQQLVWNGIRINSIGLIFSVLIAFLLVLELLTSFLLLPKGATMLSVIDQVPILAPLDLIGMLAMVSSAASELIGMILSLWLLSRFITD